MLQPLQHTVAGLSPVDELPSSVKMLVNLEVLKKSFDKSAHFITYVFREIFKDASFDNTATVYKFSK